MIKRNNKCFLVKWLPCVLICSHKKEIRGLCVLTAVPPVWFLFIYLYWFLQGLTPAMFLHQDLFSSARCCNISETFLFFSTLEKWPFCDTMEPAAHLCWCRTEIIHLYPASMSLQEIWTPPLLEIRLQMWFHSGRGWRQQKAKCISFVVPAPVSILPDVLRHSHNVDTVDNARRHCLMGSKR